MRPGMVADDLVANGEPVDVRADGLDHAGRLEAQPDRQTVRVVPNMPL